MSNPSAVLEEKPEVAPMPAGILGGLQSHATTSCPPGFAISSASPGRNSRACRCRPGPIRPGVFRTSGRSIFRPTLRRHRCPKPTAAKFSNALPASMKSPAGSFSPTINFCERDVLSEKLRKAGVIFQPLERAMIEHEDLFRRHFMSQPATLGSAKFAALHEAFVRSGTFLYVPRGVEVELPLETFPLAACGERRDFPAHARRRRRAVQGDSGRTFSLDRSPARRLRLRRERSDRRRRREGDLHLRARLERRKRLSIQINATTVARDASALNLHLASRRKIFAPRKSEPPHRRRRPQRHARGFGRRRHAGIRRAHLAGSRFAAHQRAICFSRMRSAVAPAIPSAV